MDILILGAGEHGRVISEIAAAVGTYDRIGFLDDNAADAVGKLSDHGNFVSEFDSAFVASAIRSSGERCPKS